MIAVLKTSIQSMIIALQAKCNDYAQLVKVRLNLTVVFSAVIGYLLAAGSFADWWSIFCIGLAGFLITGAANAINQILEKEFDALMKRTKNRPLAAGRMEVGEAVLIVGVFAVVGIALLAWQFNTLAAVVGAISMLIYGFIYTPLKRISPIAILVGAIPGALPPLIGWLAYAGMFTYEAYLLFGIQFLWQFPHFWAIGWLGAEEYDKAGFKLMPTPETKNRAMALQIIFYIVILLIVSLLPTALGMLGNISGVTAFVLGLFFLYYGWNLLQKCDNKAALKLMFASIIYLPVLQIMMVIDKFI